MKNDSAFERMSDLSVVALQIAETSFRDDKICTV